jgi:cell division protein FtsQ
MKKKLVIAFGLLILLTTISSNQKKTTSIFAINKIIIENNKLVKDTDIKKILKPIYNKNLFFLKNSFVRKMLLQNNYIESFEIKKIYPNSLKIKIFEKKPIAILYKKNKKFYLNEKIHLINYIDIKKYNSLPVVYGNEKEFKIFYQSLDAINFPINIIKNFTQFEVNRWDIETNDGKIIKLPPNNYLESIKNYLNIKSESSFEKYKVFDYRLNNQLILK